MRYRRDVASSRTLEDHPMMASTVRLRIRWVYRSLADPRFVLIVVM